MYRIRTAAVVPQYALPLLLCLGYVAATAQDRGTATIRFPSCKVHAFFYLWYGAPASSTGEGNYKHWNHHVLPHWTKSVNDKWSGIVNKRFEPPIEIHSPFYPAKGLYSSDDPKTIESQFREMKRAGVCAAILSWWGRPDGEGTHDTQGVNTDEVIGKVVDAAEAFEDGRTIKIGFHLEPYEGRSAASTKEDVKYLLGRFGSSRALLRDDRGRGVFYIYDSYHVTSAEWKDKLNILRGSACFVGLVLNKDGARLARDAGFDGAYTYFASNGFSYGATTNNWANIDRFLRKHSMAFVPSVGPGYDDSTIRPWNAHNTKARDAGRYYDSFWAAAIATNPSAVSITSWNEWGEGTQIEPATPKTISAKNVRMRNHTLIVDRMTGTRVYRDYRDGCRRGRTGKEEEEDYAACEDFYLRRTAYWASQYEVAFASNPEEEL
eukprot:g515.t1